MYSGIAALLMGCGVYWASTQTRMLTTGYLYEKNLETPYGLVIEFLLAAKQGDSALLTRSDEECRSSTAMGCEAMLEALAASLPAADRENLSTCIEEEKRLSVGSEYSGPHTRTHIMEVRCARASTFKVMLGWEQKGREREWHLMQVTPERAE